MPKSIYLKAGAAVLALIIISVLISWGRVHSTLSLEPTEVVISNGSSSKAIARKLENEKVISSAFLFGWYTRITGASSKLKPGSYLFEGELSMADILDKLSKGELQQFKVTIPEGLHTDEMLKLLAAHTGTDAQLWHETMHKMTQDEEYEGLFLPETYLYTKPVNPKVLLQQMYDARKEIEAEIAKEKGWNEEQIRRNRIMASIVEKETALPHERVWVSAAIHNRIRIGMPLQMDPTVIYGMYRTQGSFDGNLRKQDLRADTPWNTYTRKGLPVTPICNPGEESLRAAANPADVKYLYFVADGTGGHAFASTLEEHNRNVQKWIQIERQNR